MSLSTRALLVTPTSPWGANFGAQQRTALLYSALAELVPTDVLLLDEGARNEAAGGDQAEILGKLSWRQSPLTLYKYGVNAWASRWCHSNIDLAKYNLVVGRYITPISKIQWPRHMRTVVDCDDAFYRYAPNRATFPGRVAASARGRLRFWQTRAAIRKYDHVFFCSVRDRALFPARSSSILPNVVHARPEAPVVSQDAVGTALIVGSMWYAPNRQGVDWFLERCWPVVAARCPGLRLKIVGPRNAEDLQRWSQAPRTEAPGFVENLAGEYARALFAVAPVHYGGGTCIKFLEAAAFRRPCIVTGHVFEGFSADFRDGESVVVAREAEDMVQGCVTLYEDARRRSAVAQRAHDVVTSSYTPERFRKTVQDAVRALLN